MADLLQLRFGSLQFILTGLAFLPSFVNSQACTMNPNSGCAMSLDSGETFDFCGSFDNGPITITPADTVYTYDGKTAVYCDVTFPGQAVCLGFVNSDVTFGCGLLTQTACSVVASGENPAIEIHYNGGEGDRKSVVTVYFEASRTKEELTFLSEGPESTYNFAFRLPGSSSGSGVDPGIPGIVLIILFLAGIVAYLVIGVLVMKFYKGATGIELIPNLSFWKDFPFLLKDGAVFTFTGWPCCQPGGGTSGKEGYSKL